MVLDMPTILNPLFPATEATGQGLTGDERMKIFIETASVVGHCIDGNTIIIHSNNTQVTTNSLTYVKKKEIILSDGGEDGQAFSIVFDIKTLNGAHTYYGRIYVNGTAVGTERSGNQTAFQTYTETITGLNVGDKIQLYLKNSNTFLTCVAENLRLKGLMVKKTTDVMQNNDP